MPIAPKLARLDPASLASNPRATAECWRRYAPVVAQARSRWPLAYTYTPTSHAAATVVMGLRDSCKGQLAFNYSCWTDEEQRLFSEWYAAIIIKSIGDNKVFIGKREEVKQALHPIEGVPCDISTIPSLTFEELCAFTLLISAGHLRGGIRVIQPPNLELLPPRSNCEVVTNADGSITLI